MFSLLLDLPTIVHKFIANTSLRHDKGMDKHIDTFPWMIDIAAQGE